MFLTKNRIQVDNTVCLVPHINIKTKSIKNVKISETFIHEIGRERKKFGDGVFTNFNKKSHPGDPIHLEKCAVQNFYHLDASFYSE